MSDKIVNGGNGVTINLGDPDNCDEVYLTGQSQISADARAELDKMSQLTLVDLKSRGGPATQSYLAELEYLSNTHKIYGRWPTVPTKIEE